MWADHLVSKKDAVFERKDDGREIRIWIEPPDAHDEWFDSGYALLAGMSYLGCMLPDSHLPVEKPEEEEEPEVVVQYVEF